ncbi:cobalt ABC transporter permease, partial [Enterococcus faecalis]
MQIKQTNAAIYASLSLLLTFEISFSESILANLAVFSGCVIFFIGQRKSRLLLWLFFLALLPAIW